MQSKERKRAVRIGRLTTVMEVAAEIGRVYRDARHNRIDAALGNRLASILSAMRQCLETAEFERRIAEIEAAVGRGASTPASVFDLTRAERPAEDEDLPGSDPARRRH